MNTDATPIAIDDDTAKPGLGDLAQIIAAYTQVTDRLEKSHAMLGQEVERLQKELASTDAQLQRSRRLAALGEMAAGIAHEVRNPLAAIQLYAGVLAGDLDALAKAASTGQPVGNGALTEASQTASKIVAAVRGLDSVVNDVLVFSREITPRLARLDAQEVIERAVQTLWPLIQQARIKLVMPSDDGEASPAPLVIEADAELIHQALLNLLRNAIDALSLPRPADASPATLTLIARREGVHGVLVVRDNGPGIDQDAIDRIFNPFFTTRDTGTGLGLAIVHRIADAHGGAVAVHHDEGAVFELSLPVAGAEASVAGHLGAQETS